MRGNPIVEQAVDPVDVFVDRDRQQAFVRGDSCLQAASQLPQGGIRRQVPIARHARNHGSVGSALAQLTFRVRGVPLLLDVGHPALLHDDP